MVNSIGLCSKALVKKGQQALEKYNRNNTAIPRNYFKTARRKLNPADRPALPTIGPGVSVQDFLTLFFPL
jgi:hypothetical protein